jgi:hypothetical protein
VGEQLPSRIVRARPPKRRQSVASNQHPAAYLPADAPTQQAALRRSCILRLTAPRAAGSRPGTGATERRFVSGYYRSMTAMSLIVLLLILLLLFGGGGFYYGGPYVGGGLGTVLLIILIVVLLRGS